MVLGGLRPLDAAVGLEEHVGVVVGHAHLGLAVAVEVGHRGRAAAAGARQGVGTPGDGAVMLLQADAAVGDHHDLGVVVGVEVANCHEAVGQPVVPVDLPVVVVGGRAGDHLGVAGAVEVGDQRQRAHPVVAQPAGAFPPQLPVGAVNRRAQDDLGGAVLVQVGDGRPAPLVAAVQVAVINAVGRAEVGARPF